MSQKLIDEIKTAFLSNHEPPDERLIVKNFETRAEPYEVYQILRGKRWQEIEFADLIYLTQNFPNLTDIGFQYYLPAFLIAALDDNSGDLETFLVFSLTLRGTFNQHKLQEFKTRMSGFSTKQRLVVLKYLSLFYSHNPVYVDADSRHTIEFWRDKL